MHTTKKTFLDVNGVEHVPTQQDPITWRVSAYAVVTYENKILLIKEAWSDSYELPGGGIESGEIITSGVLRECQEETGIPIVLTSNAPFYLYQSQFVYTKDEHKSFHDSLCLFFRANVEGALAPSGEGDAQKIVWVPVEDIDTLPIQPMHRGALQRLRQGVAE